ncbi:hypothetical protein RE439_03820 [Agrobacterium rosae]
MTVAVGTFCLSWRYQQEESCGCEDIAGIAENGQKMRNCRWRVIDLRQRKGLAGP